MMSDALVSIKSLAADYLRWSQSSEAAGESGKANRQKRQAEKLEAVAGELEELRARLRPVSKEFGDLSDLPEEVMSQLSLTKVDELEQQLRDIVLAADGQEITLDRIIIELYRRHKVIQERKSVMNKLYRMAQKGLVESVEGKKGVYVIEKRPNWPQGSWGKSSGSSWEDDADIPF